MQSGHALVIEWNLSTDEHVENDAETPYVYFWPSIFSGLEQLGSGKVVAATKCLEVALGREEVAQTKVDNLDVSALADQNILHAQIPMYDAIPVAVVEGTSDLPTELSSQLVFELSM
jgi:hypothetical protein